MAVLLAVAIACISLTITPGYHFSFDITPKIVVLLAATGLLSMWAALIADRPDGKSPLYRWFSLLLLLNLISLSVSTAFSSRPGLSLFGSNWRRFGAVIEGAVCLLAWLMVVVCAGRPERVKAVMRGITVAGAVSGIYGIAQYLGWDPLLSRAAYQVGDGVWTIVRPPGTLGYASYFATWLLMVAFLSVALAAVEDSPAWRRFALTVAVVSVFAMWLTGTRAAILGLLAGVLTWLASRKLRVTRRTIALTLLAVIACFAFYYSPLGQPLRSRTRWFTQDPWGGARVTLWRDSLHMAGHRLMTGFGPEVFTAEFPLYESRELARAYPNFSHESPHNMFLDALVAQGLPGLAVLLGLCGMAFATRRRPEITAGLVAVMVSQQFTSFTVPTAMMFFVALGLLVALETPAVRPRRRASLVVAAAPVAAALLYVAVRLSAADHELALAKGALDGVDRYGAATHYQTYEQLRLPGGTADLWYSRALLELASREADPNERALTVQAAGAMARRAIETAEDPFNAWYNLAVFYGSRDDAVDSERCVRAAIAARPNWYKPHWILAQLLRVEGRGEEARQQAILAADLDAGKDPEVGRTLREISDGARPLTVAVP
ncbi:MAG TPA: O-antigen ligase family protein [Bryobacteraceae bacterium]|jgi:O-antigen ligase|nr:O-antigen ligase family protein [Bryobacteraceae bacterium]